MTMSHNVNYGPTQPKKRRKNAANQNTTPTPTPQDLLPPPPNSTFGDTIVASNPFDDTPTISTPSIHHNGMMNPHMPSGMHSHMVPPHGMPPGHALPNPSMHPHPPHGMPPHLPHNSHPHLHGPMQTHPQQHHPHELIGRHDQLERHVEMTGRHVGLNERSPLRSMHQMNSNFGLPLGPDGMNIRNNVNRVGMPQNMPPNAGGPMLGNPMNNLNSNMSSPLGAMAQMGVGPNSHLAMNSPNGNRLGSSSPNLGINSPNMGPNGNRMGSSSPHLGMNSPNLAVNGARLGSPLSGINNMAPSIPQNPNGMPPKNNGQMGPPPLNSPGPMNNGGMPMMQPQPGSRMNMANGSPINANMMPMAPQQQMHPHNNRNVPISPMSPMPTMLSPLSSLSSLSSMVGGPGPIPPLPNSTSIPVSTTGPNSTSVTGNGPSMGQMNPSMQDQGDQRHHMFGHQTNQAHQAHQIIKTESMMNMGIDNVNSVELINSNAIINLHMPPNQMINSAGPRPITSSSDKIYPPDQPYIFNPQNPNAPPIYTCGTCRKEVNDNDEALFCEYGCKFFFHRLCAGLSEAEFQIIIKEVQHEWWCEKCLASKNAAPVKIKSENSSL